MRRSAGITADDRGMRDEDKRWLENTTPEQKAAWVRQDNLTYGGLIAIGTVIIQPFLTAPSLNLTAMIAVISFAIALPHLGVMVLIEDWPSPEGYPTLRLLPSIAKSLGLTFSMIGVSAAFWHISWIAGVVVLASGIGAFIALGYYQSHVMLPEVQLEIAESKREAEREAERQMQEARQRAERKHRHSRKTTDPGHDAQDDAEEEPRP